MTKDAKKILKIAALLILSLVLVIYAFSRSRNIVLGIRIKNVLINNATPKESGVVSEKVTRITGNAKNAISLSLNGRVISINREGEFEETIALMPGYNIVNISALDKFGHRDKKNYQLIY